MDSVLLVTVDCLRPDHVGAYGYERDTTPNIDGLADEGTVYERAYSNGPGTRWAFRAINMGVFPLRVDGAGLPSREGRTLAETLSEHGYRTGAFADNPFLTAYFNHDRGFDTFRDASYWSEAESTGEELFDRVNDVAGSISRRLSDGPVYQGLKRVYDRFLRTAETTVDQSLTSDPRVVEHATDWIREAKRSDDPFFAWVHLMDAHHPHQYHAAHRQALGIPDDSEHVRLPTQIVEPGGEPLPEVVDTYDANLREADSHVGELLDAAAADTTVVLTGDHGEELGQHKGFHQSSVFESMARVPLVVRGPGFADTRIEQLVSHVDVPPTVAELVAGADAPDLWDGIPLEGTELPDRDVFLELEKPDEIAGAVVRDGWKYRCYQPDVETVEAEYLHDLTTDPHEETDVKGDHEETFTTLGGAWQSHLDEVWSSRLITDLPVWDPDDERQARSTVGREREGPSQEIEDRLEHLGYK